MTMGTERFSILNRYRVDVADCLTSKPQEQGVKGSFTEEEPVSRERPRSVKALVKAHTGNYCSSTRDESNMRVDLVFVEQELLFRTGEHH